MRLAFKRYYEIDKCGSYVEAIWLLNKNHIEPIFTGQFSLNASGDAPKIPETFHSDWRHQKYWNEEVDNLYKSHKELFEKLFSEFSNKHKTPADTFDFCHVDEFENLWVACGLIEDTFV